MMRMPPAMAAGERGTPVRTQSTMATRKMVRLRIVSDNLVSLVRVGLQSCDRGEHWRCKGDENEKTAGESLKRLAVNITSFESALGGFVTYLH